MKDNNKNRLPILMNFISEESIWMHPTLHENFWIDGKFDQSVRKKLLKIAEEFYQSTGYTAEIKDIQLTGSIANYNYHPQSDLDVHILVDFKEINPSDPKLAKSDADSKRWIWNKEHNIIIRGNDVEMYLQQVDEPAVASGLYSLKDNKWLIEPKYHEPQTDPIDVKIKADAFKSETDNLEKELEVVTDNEEAAKIADRLGELRSKAVRMRRDAFASGKDEFSVENLAWKELRNSGYVEKIMDLANKAYDKSYAEPL